MKTEMPEEITKPCSECGETGQHKIWCSIYNQEEMAKGGEYYKKQSPVNIAKHEKTAEKELDTIYKKDLDEAEQALKELQEL